ncbi:MAG TPA: hypothetical protein VHG93_05120 [Longimicrobium sp.]|nr:hypothetical protein [Longimicrobium sp.]
MRRFSLVLVSLALAACSDDPAGPGDELTLKVEQAEVVRETAAVEGAAGAVVVQGTYVAPSSGYTLRADYRVTSGGVIVSITGVPPGIGFHVISGLDYRATVPLPAGTHTVRVIHGEADRDATRHLVARQQVTVRGS